MVYTVEVKESHNVTIKMGALIISGSSKEIAPPKETVIYRHEGSRYEFKTLKKAKDFVAAQGENSNKYIVYNGYAE